MSKKKYTNEQKSVILVVALTSFLTTFMGSALNLSIPNIGSELEASAATVNWIVSIYMLTCAALAIPFGIISDKMASKIILCAGLFTFFVGTVQGVFCNNIYYLLVLRCVQAVGASMIFATNIPILISSFDNEERGKILGFSTAANYCGLFAGPVLGGITNYYLGWRYIFALSAAISMVTLIIAFRKISNVNKGNEIQNIKGKDIKENIKHIMVNKVFLYANMAAFANFGAVFGTNYLMSIYLQVVKGYTSQWAGLILIVAPLFQCGFSLLSGKISNKIQPYKISASAMIVCGTAILGLTFINANSSLWIVIVGMMIIGIGSGFFSAPNANVVMSSVKKDNYSLASSILSTMRSFGHTASIWIITFLTRYNIGDMSLSDADPQSLVMIIHVSFYFFIALCACGFLIALKGKP